MLQHVPHVNQVMLIKAESAFNALLLVPLVLWSQIMPAILSPVQHAQKASSFLLKICFVNHAPIIVNIVPLPKDALTASEPSTELNQAQLSVLLAHPIASIAPELDLVDNVEMDSMSIQLEHVLHAQQLGALFAIT